MNPVVSGDQFSQQQLDLQPGFQRVRPVSFLNKGARRFAAQRGRPYSSEGLGEMQASPIFQARVARQYEQATPFAHDVRVKKSYEAFRRDVGEQYDYLTKPRTAGGLGVTVVPEAEDPYKNHEEMINDVSQNRRLRIAQTGAHADDNAVTHPELTNEENDKFRAVHDAFGHAAIGRSFSRHGEEAAYHHHVQMFSPEAHMAMTLETRSQNSALNFGRNAGTFPDTKVHRLPAWAMRNRQASPGRTG